MINNWVKQEGGFNSSFIQVTQVASEVQGILLVPDHLVLGLQTCATEHHFYTVLRIPKSGLCTCVADNLPAEPSSQPPNFHISYF